MSESSSKNHKILLVEDDTNFGDVLKSYLEINDYEVQLAKDGDLGYQAFLKDKFDLIILDVMMPKKDGFTLANEIREKDQDTPIVFLTAKTLKEDILTGFRAGGDDYITKPFNSEELLLRIQAILRRTSAIETEEKGPEEFDIGIFHYILKTRTLSYIDEDGQRQEMRLSPKESQLLHLFCLKKEDVLERSEALIKIWGEDNYFTARSMDVFIVKLRKYLSKDPNIQIENIHGNGFRMLLSTPKSSS